MDHDSCSLKLSGAYIELTKSCNARCPYCYNDSGENSSFLPFNIVCNILDQLKREQISAVVFSGGEPFLYPHIQEILNYAEKLEITPTIITNTSLIEDDEISSLLSRNLFLQLTFDSVFEESHDKTRGNGNFKSLMRFLLFAKNNPDCAKKLIIRFNINKENYVQIDEFIYFLRQFSICKATMSFLHKSGRGQKYEKIFDFQKDVVSLSRLLSDLDIKKKSLKENFSLSYGELDKARGCAFYATGTVDCVPRIDPFGNVYLCQIFTGEQNILGNVFEDSLISILKSQRCENVLNSVRARKKSLRLCKKCPYDLFCMGGCPAIAYNTNFTFSRIDSQCTLIRYTMKNILKNNKW